MMGIDGEWGDVCNISRAERRAAVFCNLITEPEWKEEKGSFQPEL
jgi:hypothetical protein